MNFPETKQYNNKNNIFPVPIDIDCLLENQIMLNKTMSLLVDKVEIVVDKVVMDKEEEII